jgi:lysine-specific demethylase 8
MRISGAIPRVELDRMATFHERYVDRNAPVILAGAALDFPALRWTREALARELGAVSIRYKHSRSHRHPDFAAPTPGEMFKTSSGTFAEFLELIGSGEPAERARYLFTGDEQFVLRRREGKTELNPALAALLRDAPVPPLVPADALYSVWGWFSGPGVRTSLHYDNNGCHNLNAQLLGRKHCLLFPPSELEHVHLFDPGENPATNCSAVDVEAPDLARHPEFEHASALEGELEAGDLLFIPVHFLHSFRHLGELNANVNSRRSHRWCCASPRGRW